MDYLTASQIFSVYTAIMAELNKPVNFEKADFNELIEIDELPGFLICFIEEDDEKLFDAALNFTPYANSLCELVANNSTYKQLENEVLGLTD